jgi:hypothetical protein
MSFGVGAGTLAGWRGHDQGRAGAGLSRHRQPCDRRHRWARVGGLTACLAGPNATAGVSLPGRWRGPRAMKRARRRASGPTGPGREGGGTAAGPHERLSAQAGQGRLTLSAGGDQGARVPTWPAVQSDVSGWPLARPGTHFTAGHGTGHLAGCGRLSGCPNPTWPKGWWAQRLGREGARIVAALPTQPSTFTRRLGQLRGRPGVTSSILRAG